MRLKTILGCLLFPLLLSCQEEPTSFVLLDEENEAQIYLPDDASEVMKLAVNDLISDVEKISGQRLATTPVLEEAALLIFNLAKEEQRQQAVQLNPELDTLAGKWEAYVVQDVDTETGRKLLFAGSEERATMFALYHFIEDYLGVDPSYYWSDLQPEKRNTLAWENVSISQDEPTFKFRGWFINDEDLLTEWQNGGGVRNIDYPYYGQVVHPKVIRPVFETMLRLRMNLAIPASFVDIRNPAEEKLIAEASRRGLFVSMHHVEPMGVSAFAYQNYWKEKGEEPLFSFYSEPEKITETWKEYARRWAKYPNVIWQVGLRGIGDRPMWMADPGVPQSDAERGEIISEAIAVQKKIIDTLDQRSEPLLSTTLWAEGAGLNQEGHLSFPEDMLIIFADNSPGWKWQQDFYETKRSPANHYGVYYHHQLWSSGPHLVQAVPPQKTYEMFSEAVEHQASDYAIMNVSNVREFILGVEASAKMLYNMDEFKPQVFMKQWFEEHFGEAGAQVQQAYQQFFESYQIHEQTGTPFLLDGQTRSFGRNALNEIKLMLSDPAAYQRMLQRREENSELKSWGSRYLSDMHPERGMTPEEMLPHVQQQIAGLELTARMISEIEPRLSGDTLRFFQVNLEAQQKILIGLNHWLEDVLLAHQAARQKDKDATMMHLIEAKQHFEEIREGQQLASAGEKWGYWYRGDRKMNLSEVIQLTEEVISGTES